ncbi:MAG: SIS domain-containing protein [Pelagibacterales bacterium]|nr:SIS domain-containing protein [Pelagibacterales bacterium]MBL6875101.1 SIS domain-containing protein [Flavobacteriales bacterium]
MQKQISDILNDSFNNLQKIIYDKGLTAEIEIVTTKIIQAFKDGNKLLLCGNGGSASDAQHIAAELSGRFIKERKPLYAEALHVNSSYMTAVSNDYGFESTYSRMLEAIGKKGDVLIALSTSGNSENVINAVKMANSLGMLSVGMTGAMGGKIKDLCQYNIIIPSSNTARVQEAHILVGHIFCQIIEEQLFD